MGKEFKKKYMHPTRRKLVDMIKTGEYEKNTQIGYTKAFETRNVGDVWEDEHNRYEKKEGYILKTGKNSEVFDEIRKYFEEKSKCKNTECKTIKKSKKDKIFIEKGGYCLNCTIDREHQIKMAGLWIPYEDYKIATRMIIYGKAKLDSYRQSLDELKEEYQLMGSDGKVTETWKLPKPIEEVRKEILELIENGEKELQEIEQKRLEAFEKLKEKNYEHYV
jgi:predicted DNA-binding transcriptional regulator